MDGSPHKSKRWKPYHLLSKRHQRRLKKNQVDNGNSDQPPAPPDEYGFLLNPDSDSNCSQNEVDSSMTIQSPVESESHILENIQSLPKSSIDKLEPLQFHSNISYMQRTCQIISDWLKNEPNVPTAAADRLLKSFATLYPHIPRDIRTLTSQTISNNFSVIITDTLFVKIENWIPSMIKHLEKNWHCGLSKKVTLAINVDGIPIFENSPYYHFYPLLIKILEFPSKIFTACIFSSEKCKDISLPHPDIFFSSFIDDLNAIKEKGIETIHGKFDLILSGPIICDAPCRASIKRIVYFSGYSSCERCTVKGTYIGGHVALDDLSCPRRTADSFRNRVDEAHHKQMEITLLEKFGINMVDQFVIDHMHCVFIGVTKRLISRWMQSPAGHKKPQLGAFSVQKMSDETEKTSNHIPSEFSRSLEYGLKRISYWKASQLRLFLLYVGPVILKRKSILDKLTYNAFLDLSIAMRLLLTPSQEKNIPFIDSLLKNFVTFCQNQYGTDYLTYNIHNLIHLTEDYSRYGNLEKISCFDFESFLGRLKKCVRSGYKPLQQVAKFASKLNEEIICEKTNLKPECLFVEKDKTCKRIKVNNMVLTQGELGAKDNCVMLNSGQIGIISRIDISSDAFNFDIKLFKSRENFFTSPIPSKNIGILLVDELGECTSVSLDQIYSKCAILPYKKRWVCLKMIHSFPF